MNTHQVVDFGDGPQDTTLGYPFEGSEKACENWIIANGYERSTDGKSRFGVQEIPE
jgi:hypothetical protein